MFKSLDQDSPKHNVASFHPPLFLHQQTSIHAMKMLEKSKQTDGIVVDDTSSFITRVGIMADKPGAGKSYMILANILTDPLIDNSTNWERYDGTSGGYVFKKTTTNLIKVLPTNLIVVPNPIVSQWAHYCTNASLEGLKLFKSPKVFKKNDIETILSGSHDIVLITAYQFKRLIGDDSIRHVKFQRIIFDEADSIEIPGCKIPKACFIWFVTATPKALLEGRCNTRGFREVFSEDECEVNDHLIVENKAAFVNSSLNLPPYITTTIQAIDEFSSVRQFMPSGVSAAMNACDVESAISALGCAQVHNEHGLVVALLRKNEESIQVLLDKMASIDVPESLTILAKKVQDLREKNKSICQLVTNQDTCPITMEPFVKKTVTPCGHAFEFTSIVLALERAQRCPMCREPVMQSQLISVGTPCAARIARGKIDMLVVELRKVLAESSTNKVLIFSDFLFGPRILSKLQDEMIPYIIPKGTTGQVQAKIKEFMTSGKVMLLNANHFGAGLNLQMASHVFTLHTMAEDKYNQLIGRAHRIGRVNPLQVVNFRFENESTTY